MNESRAAAPPALRTGRPAKRVPTAQPVGPHALGPARIQRLQATAGNAAATALLTRPHSAEQAAAFGIAVQRQPSGTATKAIRLLAELDEMSQDRATLRRTTKVEASAWAEVGPAPPRIVHRRNVELATRDGITATLHISVTTFLPPGDALPITAEEAFARLGHAGRVVWTFRGEGGDLLPGAGDMDFSEHVGAVSMATLSRRFPGYASWPLTPRQQEAALLRHIESLPRRKPQPVDLSGGPGDGKKPTTWENVKERVTQAADLATDLVPGVSNLKDLSIFLTGRNPVTGEKVGWLGRIASLIFSIPGVGNVLKYIGRGVKHVGKMLVKAIAAIGLGMRLKNWGRTLLRGGGRLLGGLGSAGGWLYEKGRNVVRRMRGWTAADDLIAGGTQVRGRFPNRAPGANAVLYRRNPQSGKVTHYMVYGPDLQPRKRVDLTGAAHDGVPTPHVLEYVRNVTPAGTVFWNDPRTVRPARLDEIPGVN